MRRHIIKEVVKKKAVENLLQLADSKLSLDSEGRRTMMGLLGLAWIYGAAQALLAPEIIYPEIVGSEEAYTMVTGTLEAIVRSVAEKQSIDSEETTQAMLEQALTREQWYPISMVIMDGFSYFLSEN